MRIAIEGCCHGELDAIYTHIVSLEKRNNYKVDVLLICGDFQAVRNHSDLECMAVPAKYRHLGGFAKYYTGQVKAPILTIVIGGNHEASNYFWELYHGGWLAPNIYFLGHAGCVQVNGVRIAGASGIYKGQDYHKGHWERLPYNHGSIRSIYHIREYNIRRLSLLSSPTVFLSHDWPQGIAHHGDLHGLLRRKPYFRDDINRGALGSPPMMHLLRTLKPSFWFSAHLHCRFEATVVHEGQAVGPGTPAGSFPVSGRTAENTNPDEINIDEDEGDGDENERQERRGAPPAATEPDVKATTSAVPRNPDEIMLDDEEEAVETPPPPPPPPTRTQFLALDKCLPKRQFLEVVDVEAPLSVPGTLSPLLTLDPEWLAITRAFNQHMSLTPSQSTYPDEASAREAVRRELEWVRTHVLSGREGSLVKVDEVQQFVMAAPGPGSEGQNMQPPYYPNPQTAAFCAMLQIENNVDLVNTVQSGFPAP